MDNNKHLPNIVNRKALHDYEIIEKLEAGIVLLGSEIKSIRAGSVNMTGSHVEIINGEVWLFNCNISPYEMANRFNHEPMRKRKLLLHDREIAKWYGKVTERGMTIVPLGMHFKGPRVKVEIALVRGRNEVDKRQVLAVKEANREMDRSMKDALKRRY